MALERTRCAGVALLTVLFILVLLTTLSVYLLEDEHLALRRVGNQREAEQSYQAAIGSEQWALKVLERDLAENEFDHPNEAWNNLGVGGGVTVDDGALKTTVVDEQSRFNINNLEFTEDLADPENRNPQKNPWYYMFRRLLTLVELDAELADSVVDWIDDDENPQLNSYGAEDLDYMLEDPSYRAANRTLDDFGELLRVKGFNAEALFKLRPFVTVLPVDNDPTPININSSPSEVLETLYEGMAGQDLSSIIARQQDQPFEDVAEFLDQLVAVEHDQIEPLVTVESSYFSVKSEALFGRILFRLESLLQRDREEGVVRVVRRRRGLS